MRYGGWYQIAFEGDLKEELTSVSAGDRRLLCVRREGGFDVYDAVCPHRGADLAVGGKLADGCVICPYHGHRIALGQESYAQFKIRKYPSLSVGGLLFALIGDFEAGALPRMLDYLNRTHRIFPGFEKTIRIAPEMVIENAFDWAHFPTVHDVLKVTHGQPRIEDGVFTAELTLRVGPSMWQGTDDGTHDDDGSTWVEVPLLARAYSPVCYHHAGRDRRRRPSALRDRFGGAPIGRSVDGPPFGRAAAQPRRFRTAQGDGRHHPAIRKHGPRTGSAGVGTPGGRRASALHRRGRQRARVSAMV